MPHYPLGGHSQASAGAQLGSGFSLPLGILVRELGSRKNTPLWHPAHSPSRQLLGKRKVYM